MSNYFSFSLIFAYFNIEILKTYHKYSQIHLDIGKVGKVQTISEKECFHNKSKLEVFSARFSFKLLALNLIRLKCARLHHSQTRVDGSSLTEWRELGPV